MSYAALDGSGGGGTLSTSGTTMAENWGLALDPALGRVYWANSSGSNLSFASLGGTGGADLFPTSAGSTPEGVAIDAPAGLLFWADNTNNHINYGNLDGSGTVHQLTTTGATVNAPSAVALDPVTGRIYWTNENGNSIGWAAVDGSGGGTLPISSALFNGPIGLAIDPAAGELYWGNLGADEIGQARVDGGSAGLLNTAGATPEAPTFPVILGAPLGRKAPVIAGRRRPGARLTCSKGAWAPDYLGAFYYQQPQHFSYRWTRGAHRVGTSRKLRASRPGRYRCQVTPSNAAGVAAQTSAVHVVRRRSH